MKKITPEYIKNNVDRIKRVEMLCKLRDTISNLENCGSTVVFKEEIADLFKKRGFIISRVEINIWRISV